MILKIDTTDNKKTIISLDGVKLVKKYKNPRQQEVLNLIEKALKKKKARLEDIKAIKVNKGPGSFTGTRVGVAIANALAFCLGIKVNGKKQVLPVYK
jgi:tRNA threonylcarbamoyladenosine biosynthesis protein TsaB